MPCKAKDQKLEEQTRKDSVSLSGEQPEKNVERDHVDCPSCGYSFITSSNGKKKLRTRILVFAENGNAMGICPKCRATLKVPVILIKDFSNGRPEKEDVATMWRHRTA